MEYSKLVKKVKPYVLVTLLQFGYAGLYVIAKSALNQGMNHYTFSVYRNVVAAAVVAPFAFVFETKIRPTMTFPVFYKIIILSLLEPVIDQNLYYVGMKYTTATFTAAMCNIVPAVTFLLAWILRLERVNVKRVHSQAKIMGTLFTLGGAMIMTLVNGPAIGLPWAKLKPDSQHSTDEKIQPNAVMGALLITVACFCWSMFYILQSIVLKSYPAGLSVTGLVCMAGAVEGAILTLVVEKGNAAIWAIGLDTKLLACVYAGVICSGVAYYVSGVLMKEKGPVFVTSFNPLSMIIVAAMSSFFLAEQLDVGKVTGAIVIIVGLYLVIWGKTNDQRQSFYASSEITHQQEGSETNTITKDEHIVPKAVSGDDVV